MWFFLPNLLFQINKLWFEQVLLTFSLNLNELEFLIISISKWLLTFQSVKSDWFLANNKYFNKNVIIM